jgi:hypothetical protein
VFLRKHPAFVFQKLVPGALFKKSGKKEKEEEKLDRNNYFEIFD